MKSQARAVFPVRRLREQVTELEAAVLLVLNQPKKDAVHRIRTSTRRIEAQLELLKQMTPHEAGLRSVDWYGKTKKAVRKALKRLRKAAGEVRDLDVQRELLEHTAASASKPEIRRQAKHLRRVLKGKRMDRAEALQAEVKEHLDRLTPQLEGLLDVLEPLADLRLTELRRNTVIERWFAARIAANGAEGASKSGLHAIRKSAKLARYMAEGGDGTGVAALAARFEALQQAGGEWHDLLMLAGLAGEDLGRNSALARRFAQQQQAARVSFRKRLAS